MSLSVLNSIEICLLHLFCRRRSDSFRFPSDLQLHMFYSFIHAFGIREPIQIVWLCVLYFVACLYTYVECICGGGGRFTRCASWLVWLTKRHRDISKARNRTQIIVTNLKLMIQITAFVKPSTAFLRHSKSIVLGVV